MTKIISFKLISPIKKGGWIKYHFYDKYKHRVESNRITIRLFTIKSEKKYE